MLWRFELKSRWKIKLKSVFNSSLPSSCWMISSSNNATVCSLPSRWEMYDWLMFRMVTVSGTQTLCICICVRPFSHHGNLVSHNNTVTEWNNTNAHTHTHTHTRIGENKCPASCSFLAVCYWGTKPCFMWRKVETEKEACVRDRSLRQAWLSASVVSFLKVTV